MPIAQGHEERVSGLTFMAIQECGGDGVAAFAALIDAAVVLALEAGVSPEIARKRMSNTFQAALHEWEA